MKLIVIICLSSFFFSCEKKILNQENGVLQSRIRKDRKFKTSSESPLSDIEKQNFKGLHYFNYDDNFKVLAKFKLSTNSVSLDLPTSKGRKKHYFIYGEAIFTLKKKIFKLTILKAKMSEMNYFFIPFRDQTTGKSTYYTGRYLEVDANNKSSQIRIDFNTAYNPWCNYSDHYNCPIPVSINNLNIEIKAGEKIYPRVAKK